MEKPTQRSSHTGPPGYIGWTRLQPMLTDGPVRLLPSSGLADYKIRLKLPDSTGAEQTCPGGEQADAM